ncbi:transcription antitermination protein NusB [Erysipelothrix sp. HDW6B]|uniref:transcription antitermination protein NusB n=1 Tax=Erysipelothrix TaxID=1647 RepID=UPI00135CA8CF|nr:MULTISPECIES: transcription antitermination protein NusB [Erysipelothrix]QIK86181.1 transcription antitermination protein NusB [Erysipelothrix sp. HDW6B]
MTKSRSVERQDAMRAVYIHLVRDQAIEEVLEDNAFISNVSDFIPKFEFGEEMLEVIHRAVARKEIYGLALNQYLNNWKFDRLGYIEQAIMLIAAAELELGIQAKVVVLDEAVRLAKEFADQDSYKFINGVLDAI